MADWDHIECGFNALDETLNFGARSLSGLDNLYETSTLASLKNTEEISFTQPYIKAAIQNESLFFAINKTMRVFKDLQCSDLSFSATFDETVDTFCVTSDGKYQLLCLRNGAVHCFDMQNDSAMIYADTVFENETTDQPLFVDAFVECQPMLCFIVVLRNGKIYRIAANETSINDSKNEFPEITSTMLYDFNADIYTAAFENPLLILNGTDLLLYNVETNKVAAENVGSLKKIFLCNKRLLIGLDEEGHFIHICTKTFLTSYVDHDTLYHNIILLNGSHLLGITKKNENGDTYIQFVSVPDYCSIFSLKIKEKIHLIMPEYIHDEVMYIAEINHGENVNELRFQVVSETSAENRLKRLLRRQKFDEAEQCAKLFGLDVAEIQKAKAQVIVDKTVCDDTDVNNLINILNVIQDYAFKIQSCLNIHAYCTTLENVEKILKYGYLLVLPESNKDIYEENLYLQNLIIDLMFRFNTFMMLIRCGSTKSNVQDWVYFSTCDLFDELNIALKHHSMQESIIIYSRFDTLTVSNLTEEDINKVLCILNEIPIEKQSAFLNTFVPLTLVYVPSTLYLFIQWILESIVCIELKYANKFPDIAIDFMNRMMHLLKIECFSNISFHQQHVPAQQPLKDLANMRKCLEKLKMLKNDFGITIPQRHFLQGTEALVQTLLSTAVHSVGSEYFLEDFIHKFILDNHLNPDDMFSDVIKDIIKYEEEYWIKVVPVILNCIRSLNKKLEAVMIVLKGAKVPWCEEIRGIANGCLEYSHPLVDEIIQQIEYEPKCVILKKEPYKLNKKYINTTDYLKFAIGRIIYCHEPTMTEDIYQICKDSTEKHEADMLLINHYIYVGDSKNALAILDNNSQEDILKCCKKLARFAKLAIDDKYKIKNLSNNYYDIIRPIFARLQQDCSEFEKEYLQETLENLVSVYNIRKHFNVDISFKDLDDKYYKDDVLQSLISNAILEFQENNDILNCIKNCERIAIYLRIDKSAVLLKFCKQIKNFNVILAAAENVFMNETNSEPLCNIVTLILKHIGLSNTILENSYEKPSEESLLKNIDNIDVNVFIRGLKLARKMIVTAILNCNSNYLNSCLELANWIENTYYLMQENKINFALSYRSDIILPSISTLNAVRDVFYFYVRMIDEGRSLNTKYLTYFNHDIPKIDKEQLEMEILSLHSAIKYMCAEGHSLTAYYLLGTLHRSLICNSDINHNVFKNLTEIVNQSTKQLLSSVFAARYIDEELAYNLLISSDVSFSKGFLFKSLKHYKRNLLKFETIAKICLRFLQYNKIEDGRFICKNVVYLAKWWKKLKCPIPYEEFFSKSADQVLEKLVKLNSLTITLIEEFCSDFEFDAQSYYKFYLKNLLINWKADHEVQINRYGKKQLVVKNNEDHLYLECMDVINVINDKESILKMIDNVWEKINFYHYEVFMCILKIHLALKSTADNSQKNLLLLFLKDYNRVSKPGQAEIEQWYTLYPDTQSVDFFSEWRLPFTPTLFTNKIWSIIRPEINLKTYTKWFEAISILKKFLNKDDICCYVIKEIISSGVFQSKISEEWILHSKHKDLLKDIDTCIQNMSNFEQATSAIYSLITNIPGGIDRVKASALCYKYALLYQKQHPQSQDVQKAVTKVVKKYFTYSTIHILYKNDLTDKIYLEKVSGPVDELIEALYMDDRILKKAAFVTLHCPDINKAVDELAELHNLNIQDKRYALLTQWLSGASVTDFNFGAVVYETPEDRNKASHVASDNLIRASYLCTSGDIATWRLWLLKSGKLETNGSINLSFKAMALKCLCNISDTNTIEKLTDTPYEEVRIYINKLILLSSLERFGFSLTIESLDKYNKNELLNRLSYHITGSVGAKTMALVCITYTIYEFKFWALIFKAMLKFNMFEELKECVIFLKTCTPFQNNKYYIEAWQAIINNSFEVPLHSNENYIKDLCIKNFYFIQTCPVLFDINLEYVIKKCMELKQYEFAALALQYLVKEKQDFYIKELLHQDTQIYNKIEELAQLGFWGSAYVLSFFNVPTY